MLRGGPEKKRTTTLKTCMSWTKLSDKLAPVHDISIRSDGRATVRQMILLSTPPHTNILPRRLLTSIRQEPEAEIPFGKELTCRNYTSTQPRNPLTSSSVYLPVYPNNRLRKNFTIHAIAKKIWRGCERGVSHTVQDNETHPADAGNVLTNGRVQL